MRGSYGVGDKLAFSMGSGTRVKFWKDRWNSDAPLCASFPSLFTITINKEAWIEDLTRRSMRSYILQVA